MGVVDGLAPECHLCGNEVDGFPNDALIALRGQWLMSSEYDVPLFLLHPDTHLQVLQMPNGQLAITADSFGKPTIHMDVECFEQVADEHLEPFCPACHRHDNPNLEDV